LAIPVITVEILEAGVLVLIDGYALCLATGSEYKEKQVLPRHFCHYEIDATPAWLSVAL
jgi:hypothetical protein